MSQTSSNPNFSQAPSSNDAPMDFIGDASVYIEPDQKASNSIFDETFVHDTEIISSSNDQPSARDDSNPKRKRREERHLRLAAEQTGRIREKFDLPPTEQLIGSFSAALFRTILLQGRMYITTQHICFLSKLFGKVTKEAFSFTSMSRVKKRRGGLVANAIKIYFSNQDVAPIIIGSLNCREKAFSLIQERLRTLNPVAAEPRQVDDEGSAGSMGSAPGENEIPSIEGRDLTDQSTHPNGNGLDQNSIDGRNSNEFATTENGDNLSQNRNSQDITSSSASQNNSDADSTAQENLEEWESSLVWCTPDDVIDRVAAPSYEKRLERASGILNSSVKEAFNILYVSDWLKEYHDAMDNRDLVINEWHREADSYMTRSVTFRRPLSLRIGPKETRVNETQRYSFTDQGGVIIEVQGESFDVPYANYFHVESFFEMTPHGDGTQTLFVLSVSVNFLKSSMLQGKIESAVLTETKTAYEQLLKLATSAIEASVADRKGSRSSNSESRNKNQSHQSRRGGTDPTQPDNSRRAVSARSSHPARQTPVGRKREANSAENIRKEPEPERTAQSRGTQAPIATTDHRSMNSVVEVRDSSETFWLRVAALGLLGITCILLLAIVVLLNRVHGLVKTLENVLEKIEQTKAVDVQC